MPVTNASGEVAMVYTNNVPKLVDGKHVFAVKHGISLAWIPEAEAPALARRRSKCPGCGNKRSFAFATQSQVDHWTYGRRPPQGDEPCCG